jgi:TPR repeat protein
MTRINQKLTQLQLDDLLRAAHKNYDAKEYSKAVEIFLKAAAAGSGSAMAMLGVIYDDDLVPADKTKARYWFKRGFRSGNQLCAWNLAMHYASGKSFRWYSFWLNVAVENKDKEAKVEARTRLWWKKLSGGTATKA